MILIGMDLRLTFLLQGPIYPAKKFIGTNFGVLSYFYLVGWVGGHCGIDGWKLSEIRGIIFCMGFLLKIIKNMIFLIKFKKYDIFSLIFFLSSPFLSSFFLSLTHTHTHAHAHTHTHIVTQTYKAHETPKKIKKKIEIRLTTCWISFLLFFCNPLIWITNSLFTFLWDLSIVLV